MSAAFRTLPGRCDQFLQQSVSGDQRCLGVDGSCLVPELVLSTRSELVTGGDSSRGDAVLAKVLPRNNKINKTQTTVQLGLANKNVNQPVLMLLLNANTGTVLSPLHP